MALILTLLMMAAPACEGPVLTLPATSSPIVFCDFGECCWPRGSAIFADGFESGDATAWTCAGDCPPTPEDDECDLDPCECFPGSCN